jgi:hypothetical protein
MVAFAGLNMDLRRAEGFSPGRGTVENGRFPSLQAPARTRRPPSQPFRRMPMRQKLECARKGQLASLLIALSCSFTVWAFAAEPEFGGYCAMGLVNRQRIKTDCTANWTSKEGKLYCFSNEAAKNEFLTAGDENIQKAIESYAATDIGDLANEMGKFTSDDAQAYVDGFIKDQSVGNGGAFILEDPVTNTSIRGRASAKVCQYPSASSPAQGRRSIFRLHRFSKNRRQRPILRHRFLGQRERGEDDRDQDQGAQSTHPQGWKLRSDAALQFRQQNVRYHTLSAMPTINSARVLHWSPNRPLYCARERKDFPTIDLESWNTCSEAPPISFSLRSGIFPDEIGKLSHR